MANDKQTNPNTTPEPVTKLTTEHPETQPSHPKQPSPTDTKDLETEIASEIEEGQLSNDELNSGNDI